MELGPLPSWNQHGETRLLDTSRFPRGYAVAEATRALNDEFDSLKSNPGLKPFEISLIELEYIQALTCLGFRIDGDSLNAYDADVEQEVLVKSMNDWLEEQATKINPTTDPRKYDDLLALYTTLLEKRARMIFEKQESVVEGIGSLNLGDTSEINQDQLSRDTINYSGDEGDEDD